MTASDAEAVAWLARVAALEDDGEQTITLVIGPFTAFTMAAGLQLATRHPRMSPSQRALIGNVLDVLRPFFAGTPGEALIRAGDDPARDVPSSGGESLGELLTAAPGEAPLDEALAGLKRIAEAAGIFEQTWQARNLAEVCDMIAARVTALREERR